MPFVVIEGVESARKNNHTIAIIRRLKRHSSSIPFVL